MRILFTFIGGLGHFQPLVPLARAAAAAGHDVAVAGPGRVIPQVEAAGFRAFATSTPGGVGAVGPPRGIAPMVPVDARGAEREFAENFANKGARRHAAALDELFREWRPDVVVRDEADFGSAIAAEVVEVPTAVVLVLAAGTLPLLDLISPPLQAVRAEHGLPPDPGLGMLTRDLVLAPFPRSFRSPDSQIRVPETALWYRPGDRVPARPPSSRAKVYVTLGTVFSSRSGDLFERLLAGLAAVDADVLVTVGRDVDPEAFGRQPGHVRIARFIAQSRVLPETSLVVSHGGSGSLMGALAHGLPSVLLPLGADQPHNARRAEELGLARTLDAATVTPDTLRRTVTVMLDDADTAARTRRVAAEIDAQPGVDEAARLLFALGTKD